MKDLFVRNPKKNFHQEYLDFLNSKLNLNTLNK